MGALVKVARFTITGGEVPALAQPGDPVTVRAENIEGELEGVLIEARRTGPKAHRIAMVIEDGDVWRLADTDPEIEER